MPELNEYFVLFQTEGMIKASIIPSVPPAFIFQSKRFDPSQFFLVHYNHLVRGNVLVGFQFPCAEEGGKAFLVSRFANESANAHLQGQHRDGHLFAELDIWLGGKEGAESDQFLAMGTWMFESSDRDYIIVIPCERQYWWSELGFTFAKENAPFAVESD